MKTAAAIATSCPHMIAKGVEITFAPKNENTSNVPRIRTSPVTTVATDAGLAMTNHVHA